MKIEVKTEVENFLKKYEEATNTHDFKNVRPLIDDDAVYFFSNETLQGIDQIKEAFVKTWNKICEEKYVITNVKWLALDEKIASCIYDFNWTGVVDGNIKSGKGRGTNVLIKKARGWVMIHEHLSVVKE